MSTMRPALGWLMIAAATGGSMVSTAGEAHAMVGGGLGLAANTSKFLYGVCDPMSGPIWTCNKVALRLDPQGDVTHVTVTLDYDLFGPQFVFSPSESGPLGIFSVGGSAPPVTPGSGTQPFPIFPALQDTPGAALPGSTLSVVDDGLAVTVDYRFASPLSVPVETNFFVLVFDFITPVTIDASLSTVTYSMLVPFGADFTETAFSCESGDPAHPTCGSTVPSVSVTLNLAQVPEPSTGLLLGGGLALAAGVFARRRRA